MKNKLLLFIAIVILFSSCNKLLGKTCWDCEVQRMNGTTYKENVCQEGNELPQFEDSNGNDLNSVCRKK